MEDKERGILEYISEYVLTDLPDIGLNQTLDWQ